MSTALGRRTRRGVLGAVARRTALAALAIAVREAGKRHPIEDVGGRLRSMMPWISAGKTKVADASGG